MKTKAIGYVRVSTAEQVKDGESLQRQEALIQAESERQGWELIAVLRDEGISGAKPANKRPGFAALVQMVKARAVSVVLVADLSRLSRSQKDTLIFLEDVCGPAKVRLHTIDKGLVENRSVSGTMDLTLKALMAEVYRKEISEKTRRAMAFKRGRGEKLGGDVPYGFVLVGDRLEPDREEQETISLVKRCRQEGYSLREIADKLRRAGVATKRGGAGWQPSQVQRLLARSETR